MREGFLIEGWGGNGCSEGFGGLRIGDGGGGCIEGWPDVNQEGWMIGDGGTQI